MGRRAPRRQAQQGEKQTEALDHEAKRHQCETGSLPGQQGPYTGKKHAWVGYFRHCLLQGYYAPRWHTGCHSGNLALENALPGMHR